MAFVIALTKDSVENVMIPVAEEAIRSYRKELGRHLKDLILNSGQTKFSAEQIKAGILSFEIDVSSLNIMG